MDTMFLKPFENLTDIIVDLTDHQPYQICLDYWSRLKKDKPLPRWQDWKWSELPEDLIPLFMVVEVQNHPLDFVFSYWGEGYHQLHNIDMTGRSVRGLRSPGTAKQSFQQYSDVATHGRPGIFAYPIQVTPNHKHYDLASLRLPFSSDGEIIDVIATFADWRKRLDEVREDHLRFFNEDHAASHADR